MRLQKAEVTEVICLHLACLDLGSGSLEPSWNAAYRSLTKVT
jgi:hypothetical protein